MPRAAHSNLETLSQHQKGTICSSQTNSSSQGGSGAGNLLQRGAGSIPLCSAQPHPKTESPEDHRRCVLQHL